MSKTKAAGILGLGRSLPEKVLTNHDLEKMVDTSHDWIVQRTGISERRILDKNQPIYNLGVDAAKKALDDANLSAEKIDLIIVATETPDYLTPSLSCIIQNQIGAVNAAAMDLNSACSGFVYAITVADQFIKTGYYKHILIVACEGLSRVVDWKDRNTCVLFGDGAGAAVIGCVDEGTGILGTHIGADGSLGHNITIPCCYLGEEDSNKRGENKRSIWMDGSEVFKFAVKIMEQATNKILKDTNISLDDVKLIIPHQANIRIITGAVKRLGISEDKIFINIDKYANISSASIPVALDEAVKSNMISKGDIVLLVGFGGGLTWGSVVIRWNK